jgi:hypothetical protein
VHDDLGAAHLKIIRLVVSDIATLDILSSCAVLHSQTGGVPDAISSAQKCSQPLPRAQRSR